MAKTMSFNSNYLPKFDEDSTSILSRFIGGGSLNNNTILIIIAIIIFVGIALFYYFYYISPLTKTKFKPNNELIDGSNSKNAEMLFFYADWCPHCKAAKPIWNDLKTEYENKLINGYKIVFTEIDCSEENDQVEKLMNQYNIEGYPTIKLLKDGQVIEYDAKPSKEVLEKFLNTVL